MLSLSLAAHDPERTSSLSPMVLSASIGRDAQHALNVRRVFEMNRSTTINATDAVSTYIQAKDANCPQLMTQAFAEDCELEMAVRTDAISFPSSARGLEQVTQVLVTNFGDQYKNVR